MSDRTKLRRLPDRGSVEMEVVNAILDAYFLAHVGFVVDGQPFVIPTLYGRKDGKLYLHGSAASRMMKHLETGVPACVTVTLVDGIVLARSAFHHSMNYRSAVVFGIAKKIEGEAEKNEALKIVSDNVIRGRWDEARHPHPQELKATTVLEFTIEEGSTKERSGGPHDDEEDYALPIWAGVLPLALKASEPIEDERLIPGTPVPEYVKKFRKS